MIEPEYYEDFYSEEYEQYVNEQNFYNPPDAWNIDVEELNKINEEYERQKFEGDKYTREEFGRMIEEGLFIPYDGHGYFHDGEKETNISVWDTSLTPEDVEKYPYIIWYNK